MPQLSGRLSYRIYRWAWSGLDLIYPPHCAGCNKPGSRWCKACFESTHIITEPVCDQCGIPAREPGLCIPCRNNPPPYRATRSWAVYGGGLRKAIHRLKYYGEVSLGEILSRPLIQCFHEMNWQVDLVTAVPITTDRMAQRGYNQSALLAVPLALDVGIVYRSQALHKIRSTASQVSKSLEERRRNVYQAFSANPAIVKNQSVLVIDDVITSGATLQVCSEALLSAGAKEVYGLTLARAGLKDGAII